MLITVIENLDESVLFSLIMLLLFHQNDRTPLHLAAQRGHSTVAEFLVDKLKANVNLRTKVGKSYD